MVSLDSKIKYKIGLKRFDNFSFETVIAFKHRADLSLRNLHNSV